MPTEVHEVWDRAKERIRASVPASTFDLWVEPLRAVGLAGKTLLVAAPDEGRRAWVERRYLSLLEGAVRRQGLEISNVSVVLHGAEPPLPAAAGPSLTLDHRYTFDSFVIGPGNHFAHAAALAVAEVPAQAFNPLFLCAPPGLGKTHLMNAIANYIRRHSPHLRIEYLTAEGFTNDFLGAVAANNMPSFKSRLRGVDVLLVDDVQFLQGKRATEEEFFHTFNALHDAGAQIVLSADQLPQDISALADRLRERFAWGLVADIVPPNLATRRVILQKKAQRDGIVVEDETALAEIARLVPTNVRRLEGALTRIAAVASLRRVPITAALAREVLSQEALAAAEAATSPLDRIQAATGRALGIPPERIVGPDRSAAPVKARQIAMYLSRELTDLSLPVIGRAFGDRDHATVLHAIRRTRERIAKDGDTAALVDSLLTELGPGAGGA